MLGARLRSTDSISGKSTNLRRQCCLPRAWTMEFLAARLHLDARSATSTAASNVDGGVSLGIRSAQRARIVLHLSRP